MQGTAEGTDFLGLIQLPSLDGHAFVCDGEKNYHYCSTYQVFMARGGDKYPANNPFVKIVDGYVGASTTSHIHVELGWPSSSSRAWVYTARVLGNYPLQYLEDYFSSIYCEKEVVKQEVIMRNLILFILTGLFVSCSDNPEVLNLYVSVQDKEGVDLIKDVNEEDILIDSVVWNNQHVTSVNAYQVLLVDAREVEVAAEKVILFSTTVFVPAGDYFDFSSGGANQMVFYLKIKNKAFSDKRLTFSFDYEASGRYDNRLTKVVFNNKQYGFKATPMGMASIVTYNSD